jgi:hypothetical protein
MNQSPQKLLANSDEIYSPTQVTGAIRELAFKNHTSIKQV